MATVEAIIFVYSQFVTLQGRHNGRESVSNYQPHDCLLSRLFRRRSRKYQSSASLAFVRGIHRGPVNCPHKWPVTRKMFPFDDVIMQVTATRYLHEASFQIIRSDLTWIYRTDLVISVMTIKAREYSVIRSTHCNCMDIDIRVTVNFRTLHDTARVVTHIKSGYEWRNVISNFLQWTFKYLHAAMEVEFFLNTGDRPSGHAALVAEWHFDCICR